MNIVKAFTAIFLAAAVLLTGEARASEHHLQITGSWDVTVSFTRPEGLPPVKAIYTFTAGGTMLMTAENDRRTIGPGHGVWMRTDEDQFGVTFVRMRFDPETAAYIGTLKVRLALNLREGGDELSGPYDSDFFDRDGHLTGPAFAGSIEARKITVEPLD